MSSETDALNTIGKRLKYIRLHQDRLPGVKMSQEEFGQTIGKDRSAYAMYEIDRVVPDETVLMLVCEKYKVNIDWLKNGNPPIYNRSDNDTVEAIIRAARIGSESKIKLMRILAEIPDAVLEKMMEYLENKTK